MNIEGTIKTDSLPVNSKAMIHRLSELLEENETNCLNICKDDPRVKAVLWLLNSQVFGQMANIDMAELWQELNDSPLI